jgi:hypothetical protein
VEQSVVKFMELRAAIAVVTFNAIAAFSDAAAER